MSLGKAPLKMPQAVTAEGLAGRISVALRASYGDSRHAITRLSRRISADPRAVENWMYGRCAPRSAELVRLMAENDAVAAVVLAMAREAREGQA
jgi:hypothetical protein